MRCLLTLCITASCLAQPGSPSELERQLNETITGGQIVEVISEWRRPMSEHTVTFDNGQSVTGSAAVTFDRDTAAYAYTYAGDAVAVAADEPRYAEEFLIFGAPEWITLDPAINAFTALGAGLDSTGQSLAFAINSGTAEFQGWRGETKVYTRDLAASLGAHTKPSSINDLLAGETDEEADYCFEPVSVEIHNGLIVVGCSVRKYDGLGDRSLESNWLVDGYGGCFSDDDGATWRVRFRATEDNSGAAVQFGKPWSLNIFADGDTVWIAEANYNAGGTRTATTYLSRATKSGSSWTTEDAYRIGHTVISSSKTHAHTAFFDAASGQLVTFIGDSSLDSRNEMNECTNVANYLTGASVRANALNSKENGTNWNAAVVINGTITGDAEGTGQPISLADAFMGGDEEYGPPIMGWTVPTVAGDPTQLTRGYGYSMSNHDAGNWRVFTLQSYNGGVVATVAPGNGWDTGNDDGTRIVYKPAGQSAWGVLAAVQGETGTSQARPVITPDGYCLIGTQTSQGLRAIKLPTSWRSQRGLITGAGARNYAAETPTQRSAPSGGNTVAYDATPPQTAPCDAKIMRIVSPDGATSNNLGYYYITNDEIIGNGHTWMTIVAWVYAPEWDGSAHVNRSSMDWRCRFFTKEYGTGGAATGFVGPSRMTHVGSWWKIEYQIENGAAGDWNLASYGAESLVISLQMQTTASAKHEQDFYIGWAGIYLDADASPSYAPPASTGTAAEGDNESLELSGFAGGDNWTIAVVLQIDDHGRDLLHHTSGTYRSLLTLFESGSKHIEIESDAGSNIKITAKNSLSTATATLTGLPLAMRGDPLMVAISYDGTAYTYALSYGGSVVRTGTITANLAVVKPIKILPGQDHTQVDREAVRTLYAIIKDDTADDGAALEGWVKAAGVVESGGGGGRRTRSRNRRIR